MDDKITDKLWIFLLGWAGLIFAVYPMTKDLAENQPETVSAMVKAIIFSFLLVLGFFIFSSHKKLGLLLFFVAVYPPITFFFKPPV